MPPYLFMLRISEILQPLETLTPTRSTLHSRSHGCLPLRLPDMDILVLCASAVARGNRVLQ